MLNVSCRSGSNHMSPVTRDLGALNGARGKRWARDRQNNNRGMDTHPSPIPSTANRRSGTTGRQCLRRSIRDSACMAPASAGNPPAWRRRAPGAHAKIKPRAVGAPQHGVAVRGIRQLGQLQHLGGAQRLQVRGARPQQLTAPQLVGSAGQQHHNTEGDVGIGNAAYMLGLACSPCTKWCACDLRDLDVWKSRRSSPAGSLGSAAAFLAACFAIGAIIERAVPIDVYCRTTI